MAQSNHAIVIKTAGEAKNEEVSVPDLSKYSDFILVKVAAVALNPTDWKHIDYVATPGTRVGCDYAGTVLEVGSDVRKKFTKGDRVAGFTHGSSKLCLEYGCFGEIIIAKADLSIAIPENLSFEEASTLGVGLTTVAQGLYGSLDLPYPAKGGEVTGKDVLIYGGSTATGSLAIQFAKVSGLRVLTTCSPRNFEYVKSLGASEAFDYNSPSVIEDIKAASSNALSLAFDCISEGESPRISVSSFGPDGGKYATLLPVDQKTVFGFNNKVEVKHSMAYTALGERVSMGPSEFPANPEERNHVGEFWEISRKLLGEGKIKVHRPSVNNGGKGLEGAMHGLELLRKGEVSGEKLVYTL